MTEPAVIAASRFGLGARPGDLTVITANPRNWLLQQISATPAPHPAIAARPDMQQRIAALPDAKAVKAGDVAKKQLRDGLRTLYLDDVSALLTAQLDTEACFLEGLVQFWSNHFTVSGTRPQVYIYVVAL